ncbi:MAG: hypothetical protein OEL76_08415 [Siculibacillus sp.]|nr:hypothetical protein [Siculibacillus sp.]
MIGGAEIVRSLRGSWRLLVGDERGMTFFDTSIEGFWRSFGVMILCLPVPWVELSAQRFLPLADRIGDEAMSGPLYWIGGFVAYGLSWIAFPLLLSVLAGPLGISRAYVPFMVARNWTTLIGVAPSFLFTALFLLGLLPLRMLGPLNLAALGFGLYYAWQVTRIACATPPGATAGLVALDFLVSLVVYTAADRVIGL